MNSNVMTHGVESIGEFKYNPDNSHCIGFTLHGVDGSETDYTFWGLTPEKASEFYERNTQVHESKRVKELEGLVERYKAALQKVADCPDPKRVAQLELAQINY